jgi:hypothetical protein
VIATKNNINLDGLNTDDVLGVLTDVADIPPEYLDGKGHPCPVCGGKDRFSLIDKAKGTVFCRRCFSNNNRGLISAVEHYGHATNRKEAYQMIKDHLLNSNNNSPSQPISKTKLAQTGVWVYTDENKKYVKKVARWSSYDGHKEIKQLVYYGDQWITKTMFSGTDEEWTKLYNYASSIPLYLPTLLENKNETVFIVEGEKCCDVFTKKWNYNCATTGSGGVNTLADWGKYLNGRDVVILPDSDAAGYTYALKTAKSLQGKATNIRIVFLPNLEEKEDVHDWVKKGGTKKQFFDIVANTPTWDGNPFAYKKENAETETETENMLPEKKLGVIEESYEDVKVEQIDWLLSGIIPLSMVSCLVGDPENGKSTIYQWLAAKITSQEATYFRDAKIPHGSVIFCNAEEVPGITTKPRLIENGADVSKIHRIKGVNVEQKVGGEMQVVKIGMTIEKGGMYLRQMLQLHPDCKLVVFDPIAAFYGRIDNYRESDIRPAMESLNEIAHEFKIAIILVMHFSKMNTTKSIDKAGSSKAVLANARTGWSTTKDHETGIITFAKVKNNISPDYMGFEFEIVPGFVVGEEAGHVNILDEFCEKQADDFLREQFNAMGRGRPPVQCDAAREWLIDFLKDGAKPAGSVNPQSGSIRYEAEKAGFHWKTIRNASKGIINKPERKSETKRNESFWSLMTCPKFGDLPQNKSNLGQVINPENTKIYDENSMTCPKFVESKEFPESNETVITTTVEEAQKRMNQILENRIIDVTENKRLERINGQIEQNFKKMQAK